MKQLATISIGLRSNDMHQWGDKDFDWEALDKAITYIHKRFRRYKLYVIQSKEKFGTARIYCRLGWNSLHDITHTGYAYYRYPKWLVYLDIHFFPRIITPLNKIVIPFQKWLYRNTYKRVCDKYPHIKEEICCMADFVELLDFYDSKRKEIK